MSLLRLELHLLLRRTGTPIVLALLAAAMLVAAFGGVHRVESNRATLATLAGEERQAVAAARDRFARWSRPAPLQISQFLDSSDTYSYFYNFLTVHQIAPPAPLALLAVGQSDVQPSWIRINPADPLTDAAFEMGNPRALRMGAFDLLFVLVFLVPLAVIAIGGTMLSEERDSGVLRMIAAQPRSLRAIALAKAGALATVTIGGTCAALVAALLLAAPAETLSAPGTVLLLSACVACWTGLWVALCLLAGTFARRAASALLLLVALWISITLLVPAAARLAIGVIQPPPSRVALIDATRAAQDRLRENPDAAVAWWRARTARGERREAAGPEERRLAGDAWLAQALAAERRAFADHEAALMRATDLARIASPATIVAGAMEMAAGTDALRGRRLRHDAEAYAGRLRDWFTPRILAVAADPRRPCPACPGRLNFDAWDAVPTAAPTPADGAGRALLFAIIALGSLAGAILAAATIVLPHRLNRDT